MCLYCGPFHFLHPHFFLRDLEEGIEAERRHQLLFHHLYSNKSIHFNMLNRADQLESSSLDHKVSLRSNSGPLINTLRIIDGRGEKKSPIEMSSVN